MENVFLVDKNDLADFMKEQVLARYENIEVSAPAACEVLQISMPTLDRWVKQKVVQPSNEVLPGQRAVRKFNLAMLLSLDKKTLKKEYRSSKNF